MESWQALKLAIGGETVRHAKRLKLSSSMVSKWQEPANDFTDCGALNPLDRVEEVVATALELERPEVDALAPIYYLANRFRGVFLPPAPRMMHHSELGQRLCASIREFGEFASEMSAGLEDGRLSPAERRRVAKEGHEAIHAIAELIRMVGERE